MSSLEGGAPPVTNLGGEMPSMGKIGLVVWMGDWGGEVDPKDGAVALPTPWPSGFTGTATWNPHTRNSLSWHCSSSMVILLRSRVPL